MINRIVIFLISLFVIGCSTVQQKPIEIPNTIKFRQLEKYQGYDVLALAMYCNGYLTAPKLPAVSTLLGTFGDPIPCLKKRIAQGGLKLAQIDLIDGTCWRNGVCDKNAPKPTDLKAIESRAKQIQVLADSYPDIKWQISPVLEHDIKDIKTLRNIFSAAKNGCPKCDLVNSPFSGLKEVDSIPLELHGTTVKAYSTSGDGKSMFDADTSDSDGNNFNHCSSGYFSTYGWINPFNCRCTGEKDFVPPLKRTHKPSASHWIQIARLFKPEPPKPAKPASCKSVVDFRADKGEINKPNAEKYCNGQPNEKDARGDKNLVIITKKGAKKGEKASVINQDGKEVGCFSYYGLYEKNLHRWYLGNCSGETPTQLMNELGSEWGFIKFKDGQCLRFNAIRRLGITR